MAARLNWTRILLGLGGALAVAGLVSFGVAYAETPQGPAVGPQMKGPDQMMPLGRMFRQLGVTADQRQQLRAILEKHQADLKPLRDRALAARRGLADAIEAPEVNEQAIRDASAKLAAAQADLAVIRAKVRAEAFQVLTPEQREKALELEKQARERLSNWRQSRGRKGGV